MPATNSASVKFKLEGVQELNRVLEGLKDPMRTRVLAEGVTLAAKPLVQAAKSYAPKRTGALRKSIKAVVRRYPRKGVAIAVVGPSTEFFKSGKKIKNPKKGESRSGIDQPSKYAHLVEFGHQNKGGKGRTPAHPFMRPAVIATRQLVTGGLVAGISKGLIKEVKRLARASSK